MITIVDEKPEHTDAVRRLTLDTFAASELGYNGEADRIDALRAHSIWPPTHRMTQP